VEPGVEGDGRLAGEVGEARRAAAALGERTKIDRRDRLQNPTHVTLSPRRAGASGKAFGYPSGVMQTSLRPSIPRISLISRSRTRMTSVHVVPRPASWAAKNRFWSATVVLSTSCVPSGSTPAYAITRTGAPP